MINDTVQELGIFGLYILLMSTKERTIECHNCEHYSITYPAEPFVQTRASVFELKACILSGPTLVHFEKDAYIHFERVFFSKSELSHGSNFCEKKLIFEALTCAGTNKNK